MAPIWPPEVLSGIMIDTILFVALLSPKPKLCLGFRSANPGQAIRSVMIEGAPSLDTPGLGHDQITAVRLSSSDHMR